MFVIPNVYQAYYMDSLVRNKYGPKIIGKIQEAYKMGYSQTMPYEINYSKKGNKRKGDIIFAKNQEEVADQLINKYKLTNFPEKSFLLENNKTNKNPRTVSQRSVSEFLKLRPEASFKVDDNIFKLSYSPQINESSVVFPKKDLFNFN